ncbi:unnamed protein product [Peniophora sp. CBMAI 1063]|nr:unnamed protein product [Peniophora sp. CBMAI 1063]
MAEVGTGFRIFAARRYSSFAVLSLPSLPTEILIHIFQFLADIWPPTWVITHHYPAPNYSGSLGWIAVTYNPGQPLSDITSFATRTRSTYRGLIHTGASRSPPFFFPATRVLHIDAIRLLEISEVLDLLGRTPLLQALDITRCRWTASSVRQYSLASQAGTVALPNLKSLTLAQFGVESDQGQPPNAATVEILYNRLHFPHEATITLVPDVKMSRVELRRVQGVRVLRRLMTRMLSEIGWPTSSLCACFEAYPSAISFTEMTTFDNILALYDQANSIPEPDRYRYNVGRATLHMGQLYLDEIFTDFEISNLIQDIPMLSFSTSWLGFYMPNSRENGESPKPFFLTFANVRIIHVSQDEDGTWQLLEWLAGGTDQDRFPKLEELWLGPLTHFDEDIDTMQRLVDVVRRRVEQPDNALHTVRLSILRPAADDIWGSEAQAFERIIPTVVWNAPAPAPPPPAPPRGRPW